MIKEEPEVERKREQQMWFTADLHLSHENIMRHCKRPFGSIEEHDKTIITNINELVKPGDWLYILGDFALAHAWSKYSKTTSTNSIQYYRQQINCRNVVLIMGNHDPHFSSGAPKQELIDAFTSVHEILRIKFTIHGIRNHLILCHYAMRTWRNSHHGSWHIYGHSHGQLSDDPLSLSFDVGVDSNNFKPLKLEQISKIMKRKLWRPFHVTDREHKKTAHELIMERLDGTLKETTSEG